MVVSENGGSETFSNMLHQNVSFRSCEHSPWTIPDFQQVNVEHLMVMFTEGTTLRYAITNKVGPVGGKNIPITKQFYNVGYYYLFHKLLDLVEEILYVIR